MLIYYICFTIYFLLLFITGFPLACYFLQKYALEFQDCDWVFAPLFGLALLLWVGLIGVQFGWPQLYLLVTVGGFQLILTCILLRRGRGKKLSRNLKSKILVFLLLFFVVSIAFTINSLDLLNCGWRDYFPLTNGDTFSYLGHIDQIFFSHQEKISITYPSGTQPGYQHAIGLRTTVAAHLAGMKALFGLDTHEVFFFALRAAIALLPLGAFCLLAGAGLRLQWTIPASFIIAFSNCYFHAFLQQFLSTVFGLPLLLLAIAILLIAFQIQKYPIFILAGWFLGVFAITSIEAHIFLLILIFLFLLLTLLTGGGFINSIKWSGFIFAGYFIATLPIVDVIWKLLYSQGRIGMGGHPGDWFAQKYCLLQLAGIKSQNVISLIFSSAYIGIFLIVSIGSVLFYFLKRENGEKDTHFKNSENGFLFLGFLGIVLFLFGLFFFIKGKGYALLKFTDYHSILIVPISLASLYYLFGHYFTRRNNLFLKSILVIGLILISLSFSQKLRWFTPYINQLKHNQFNFLQMESEIEKLDSRLTYSLDLNQDLADLVLYANRMKPNNITSLRFSHRYRWPTPLKIDYILRGAGLPMEDINRPPWGAPPEHKTLEMVEYHNYIMIDYTAENSGWVGGPEGDLPCHKLRWFNKNAPFIIFSAKDLASNRYLHLTLYPGPDLMRENLFLIKLERGETFSAEYQFLGNGKEIILPLPLGSNPIPINGQIEVIGPHDGLRQLRIGNIYVETRGVAGR